MIPFKELLNPVTGFKDRIPWDASKANVKLQEMRQVHKDRLNAEDCARARQAGIGHLVDEDTGTLRTLELKTADAESVDGKESTLVNGQYVVNHIASSIKHSGATLNDAFIPEWRTFCSRPQNDDNVEYPVPAYVPKETRGRSAVLTAPEPPPTPVRRGPGRPRRTARV
jgi:hypothetical protein